jgi:NAD(P)H-hydrate repair Nnr-like enzyme with NAD(P)H-hydrate epimerase domain
MQRAGLAVAKMTLAIAPHAQNLWLAFGRGNSGGNGLEAPSICIAEAKQLC